MLTYRANSTLEQIAIRAGREMRETLSNTSGRVEMHCHVNYAYSDENLEALYGYENWGLEKPRTLKKLYDPKEKLNIYVPIQRKCLTSRTEP